MDQHQLAGLAGEQLFQAAEAMSSERLAGMFGAMNGTQIGEFNQQELLDAATAMKEEHFQFMDSDGAFGLFTGMGLDEALNLDGGQLAGLATAVDGSAITNLNPNVLGAMATNLEAAAIGTLDPGTVSGMLAGLDGEQVTSLDDGHREAALGGLNADLPSSGAAGFEDIRGGATAFDLLGEALDTVAVDGVATLASLVEDGDSPLQEGALIAFSDLFCNN